MICVVIVYRLPGDISKRHDKPDEDEEYEVVRQETADKHNDILYCYCL